MEPEKNSFKLLIETLPNGFSRHQVVLDEQGRPVDFIFLQANAAFEKMTGLKREKILGRRVTEVLPGVEKGEFDWIGVMGKVALDGISLNFEQYSEPLGRFYDVQAYSDEKGYFTTVFNEITARRQELVSIRELLKLNEMLLGSDLTAIDYQAVVNGLLKLSGARFAALNTYEENCSKSVTRAIAGLPAMLERISDLLGFDITGKAWDILPERLLKIEGGKLIRFPGLFETSMGALSKNTAGILQKMAGIGAVYVLELAYGGRQPLGDIIFFMPKNKEIENREAIELCAGQIGTMLSRLKTEEALTIANKNMTTILENSFFGVVIIDKKRTIRWVNPVVCTLAGVKSPEELIGRNCADYLCPAQQQECPILDHGQVIDNSERILRRKDGQTIPILKSVTEIVLEGEDVLLETFVDITERKEAEEALAGRLAFEEMIARVSAKFVNLPPEQIDEGINYALESVGQLFEVDRSYLYRFDDEEKTYSVTHTWCRDGVESYFEKDRDFPMELTPWWVGELKSGRLVNIENVAAMGDEAALDRADFLSEEIKSIFTLPLTLEGRVFGCFGFDTVREQRTWTSEQVALLHVVAELITGAMARHEAERQIRRLSFYDQLTGLYNRRYFEHEMTRLGRSREHPITVISADLDGLKLVNDTVGHNEGDRYLQAGGELLKSSLRASDILARVGGDEFALLLPRTDRAAAELLVNRIRRTIDEYNLEQQGLPLSISIGLAVSAGPDHPLEETFRAADNNMYHHKLQQGKQARAAIVSSLLASLFERGSLAEGSSAQVQELAVRLGQALELSEADLANLGLLAQVFDLGKVGLPDSLIHRSLLTRGGELTEAEREAIHRHPEAGYRIASSSPDLADIAELILHHHENYDGTGYPLGLKGDAIPLQCRILSIAIAYSAMTNPRSYAETLAHDEALAEIKRCAGSQFDPQLVEAFVNMLAGEADSNPAL